MLCVGGESVSDSDSHSDSDNDSESKRSNFSSGENVGVISLTQTVSRLVSVLHYGIECTVSREIGISASSAMDFLPA